MFDDSILWRFIHGFLIIYALSYNKTDHVISICLSDSLWLYISANRFLVKQCTTYIVVNFNVCIIGVFYAKFVLYISVFVGTCLAVAVVIWTEPCFFDLRFAGTNTRRKARSSH